MTSSANNSALIKQQRLELIYSARWKKKLSAYAEKKYYNFSHWESWFEDAHQNLALKIDKLPTERDVSDALIFAVFKNELTSVVRKENGYPRPRKWLLELSDMGQSLFEWVCLKKLSRKEVLTAATQLSQASTSTPANKAQVEEFKLMVEKILDLMSQKQECAGVRPVQADDEATDVAVLSATQPSTEEEADLEKLRLVLQLLIGDEKEVSQYLVDSAPDMLKNVRQALRENPLLSNTDTLILRCYYFQGMSQNDIAKLLKQPLQKTVRQREAAINRLREFMESHGLDRKSLL